MFKRRNNISIGQNGPVTWGAALRVVVYPKAGRVASNGSSATIPLEAGHSFAVGDKGLLDPGGQNIITGPASSVGAAAVTFPDSTPFIAGMKLVNLGPESSGAGVAAYDSSPMVVYAPGTEDQVSNALVFADSQGNYAYDYPGSGQACELILSDAGEPLAALDGYAGPSKIVNVVDYGAGWADPDIDLLRINAAVRSVPTHGELFVPRLTYNLSDGVSIRRGDITIRFEKGAKFEADSDPNGIKCLHIFPSSGRLSNIQVIDFWANDSDPFNHVVGDESHGIVAEDTDDLRIIRPKITGMGDEGIDLIRCDDWVVVDPWFDGNGAVSGAGASMSITNSSRGLVKRPVILNQKNGAGVRVDCNVGGTAADFIKIQDPLVRNMQNTVGGQAHGLAIVFSCTAGQMRGCGVEGGQFDNIPDSAVKFQTPAFAPGAGEGIHDVFVIGAVIIDGGDESATGGGVRRGAIDIADADITGGVIQNNMIDGWGVSTQSHFGIRCEGVGMQIGGNSIKANANANAGGYSGGSNIIGPNYAPDGFTTNTGDETVDTTVVP